LKVVFQAVHNIKNIPDTTITGVVSYAEKISKSLHQLSFSSSSPSIPVIPSQSSSCEHYGIVDSLKQINAKLRSYNHNHKCHQFIHPQPHTSHSQIYPPPLHTYPHSTCFVNMEHAKTGCEAYSSPGRLTRLRKVDKIKQ
jgi:hypothetical protein